MKTICSLQFIVLLCSMGCAGQLCAAEVSIAVAANFTDACRDLVTLFDKTSSNTARASFGSTGKLYTQIENGAPFEVFLAADTARPMKAENAGLAVAGSLFVYAKGKLVLWSAHANAFTNAETYLKNGDFSHIAIANPKTAPYGLAARQVMDHLGVWSELKGKIVQGESIAQAFQFIATGNADAGFVSSSQLKAWKGEPGTRWNIPDDYYAPIEQGAILLNKGESNPAALAFIEFLKSDAARAVIQRYGYGVSKSNSGGY